MLFAFILFSNVYVVDFGGAKTSPGGPRRCLKRCLEAVASFWPSLSPNGAMGTRLVAETVVLGLMTGDD